MINPLVRPVAAPMRTALITANKTESVEMNVPMATHPASAATEPGARSTIPAMISMVSPNATMVITLTCLSMFVRFSPLRNAGVISAAADLDPRG
jgi:hypothetical protein